MGASTVPVVPFWKCLAAGLPSLLLGAQFLGAALGLGKPFLSAHALGPLMQVEFLALHAGLFLGAFGFVTPRGPEQVAGQRAILIALFLFYLAGAAGLGWRVAIEFVLLMVGTNLGLFLSRQSGTVIAQMVARWGIGFLLFLALASLFDLPKQLESWADADEVLPFGAAYFLINGLLDVSGFYLRTVPRWYLTFDRQVIQTNDNFESEMQGMFAWVGKRLPRWAIPQQGLRG